MFALAFLFLFLLYLLISAGLAWVAVKLARKRGIKGWMWGLPVFVLMVSLIFWDWLPMDILHRHSCATYGGLTVYKTPYSWKQENPGVAETLNPEPEKSLPEVYWVKTEGLKRYYLLPNGTELVAHYDVKKKHMYTDLRRRDGTKASWLNQRFAWEIIITHHWFHIYEKEERIIDINTGEILAKDVDFRTNIPPLGLAKRLSDYKFWMQKNSCGSNGDKNKWLVDGDSFYSLKIKFKQLKGICNEYK